VQKSQRSLYRIHLTGIDWVREEFTASHLYSAAQVPYHFGPCDRVVSRELGNHLHIVGLLDYNNTFNGQDHVSMADRLIYSPNKASLIGIGRTNSDLTLYQFHKAGMSFFAVWNRSLGWRLMNVPWRKGPVHVLDTAGYPGATNQTGALKTSIPPDAVDYIAPSK